MRYKHTILVSDMAPLHFKLLEESFRQSGYDLIVLKDMDSKVVDEGLIYVNNDACYPAIIVIGQIIQALKSGQYDLSNTSVMITQTGGGCRATNYIGFLRKALKDAGFGFKFTLKLLHKSMHAIVYGDLLTKVLHRVRPYEKIKGSANQLCEKWVKRCSNSLRKADSKEFEININRIVKDF